MLLFYWYDDQRRGVVTLFTPWTLAHIAVSVIAAGVFRDVFGSKKLAQPLLLWTALHLAYEAKDVYMSYMSNGNPNSFVNSVGDQAIAMLAFWASFALRVSLPGAIFIAIVLYGVLASGAMSKDNVPVSVMNMWIHRG